MWRQRPSSAQPQPRFLDDLLAVALDLQRRLGGPVFARGPRDDLDALAAHDFDVAGRDGEPERGGRVERLAGREQAARGGLERAGHGDQREREAEHGHERPGQRAPEAPGVLGLLDRHVLDLAAEGVRGGLAQPAFARGGAAGLEVEQRQEPVARAGRVPVGAVRHVGVGHAREHAEAAQDGREHEPADEAERERRQKPEQHRPQPDAEPQRALDAYAHEERDADARGDEQRASGGLRRAPPQPRGAEPLANVGRGGGGGRHHGKLDEIGERDGGKAIARTGASRE